MTVFVVTVGPRDFRTVRGVFSTVEMANAFGRDCVAFDYDDKMDVIVEPFELDDSAWGP
jgi:hypothetical protein